MLYESVQIHILSSHVLILLICHTHVMLLNTVHYLSAWPSDLRCEISMQKVVGSNLVVWYYIYDLIIDDLTRNEKLGSIN